MDITLKDFVELSEKIVRVSMNQETIAEQIRQVNARDRQKGDQIKGLIKQMTLIQEGIKTLKEKVATLETKT